jgi:putative hemolysin
MGQVPSVAESFEWRGLRFEIVDMDGKRIDKVLVVSKDAVRSANTTPDSGSVAQQKPQERDE